MKPRITKWAAALALGLMTLGCDWPTANSNSNSNGNVNTNASPLPAPVVKITEPAKGARVKQTQMVRGTSQNLRDEQKVWVVVYIPTVGRYYPQNDPAVVRADGNWSSVTYIGNEKDKGLGFEIFAVMAGKDVQDAFRSYLKDARDKSEYAGMEQPPPRETIGDSVTVTRE
ncbi:MAG TPA: hypothetical protein VD861_21505 [Pyrinomonadaceae bacterium]|jgi:hypothetical protein|nr:hypothetical protein [Pyrinomonadaceae bacterium]